MRASDFGITATGSSAGQELVLCPFHQDSHASAWYDPVKGLFFCSVCNVGYNNAQLARHLGLAYEEIVFGHQDDEPEDYDLLGDITYTPPGVMAYVEYFLQRRIHPATIDYYGVRWSDESAAAVIPITDVLGKEIGCALRYLDSQKSGTRYRFLGSSAPLWPMHRLTHIKQDEPLIITEGAWSAMRLQTVYYKTYHSFGNFFALLGAKANERVAQVVMSLPTSVIVLYDDDAAGERACEKLKRQVTGVQVSLTSPSPDDMSDEEIRHYIISNEFKDKVRI